MKGIPRKGIVVPLVTPFTREEEVDFEGLRRNLEFLLKTDVHGLIVLPTAGEAPSLTTNESEKLIDLVTETVGDAKPVIVGVGGLSVRRTEHLIRYAENASASGLFVISPYFYKLTPKEYLDYYRRIAAASSLEMMVYNSTYAGCPLTLDMIDDLAGIPTFVALKEGNQLQLGDCVRRFGGRISIFTARDLYIFETLANGGQGAIAFTANLVPGLVLDLFQEYETGDISRARDLQHMLNPLVWGLVSRSYPAPLKAAMNIAGLDGGYVRSPLSDLNQGEIEQMKYLISTFSESSS